MSEKEKLTSSPLVYCLLAISCTFNMDLSMLYNVLSNRWSVSKFNLKVTYIQTTYLNILETMYNIINRDKEVSNW